MRPSEHSSIDPPSSVNRHIPLISDLESQTDPSRVKRKEKGKESKWRVGGEERSVDEKNVSNAHVTSRDV
jgi:hypothetical protein